MTCRPRPTTPAARGRSIYRVTFVGMGVNVLLAAFKLLAGIAGRSGAMIADAVHSLSDLLTDVVVLLFVRLSSRPHDADHRYGHGKYETLATILIALALGAVGAGILLRSVRTIHAMVLGAEIPRPGSIALWAAGLSILVKELLYRYTLAAGRRSQSSAVEANAWHHRSDALSSVGTLIGIGCARFLGEGWRIMDPIAAGAVAVLILRVAFKLIRTGTAELLEKALPRETEEEILALIGADARVQDPHNLKTRRIGSNIAVEVHIRLPGSMSVEESHRITVEIEQRLRNRFTEGAFIAIHVEPFKRVQPAP